MKTDLSNNYYIKRIRLINFHNFVNETIDIADRGHLFVLGDNGSGKTTLVDAVHYVLTAGESMEFNSAARVTGNKTEGRRVHGIITRYNIDKGHLNPNGAITYAALEIIGHNGNPWTIAIGMSVNSPEENLSRWGIIRSGNLESIPFLIEKENGEYRPRTASEMKKELGDTGVYRQLQRYKNILAQQFLGGEKQFKDFCKFLSMGKAYRELASKTSDYNELFKELLPEPRRDLFEKIIDSLKSLDNSKNDIQSLKDKYEYIKTLLALVNKIKYKRKHALAGECIALQFEIEDLKNTLAVLKHRKTKLKEKQDELKKEFDKFNKEKIHIDSQLEDFRQKDAAGLLREEKNIIERIKQVDENKNNLSVQLEKLNAELNKLKDDSSNNTDKIKSLYKDFLSKFTKLSLSMPFSISELIAAFEKFIHMDIEESVAGIQHLKLDEYFNKANNFRGSYVSQISKLDHTYNEHINQIQEIEKAISALEEQLEFLPDIEYFADVVREFKEMMINFKPLYKGLTWNKGIGQKEMDAVEEFIGPEVLCSIILSEESFNKAEEFVYSDYPGIRLVPEKRLDPFANEIPAWIKQYFDLSKSDPDSIKALAAEMCSVEKPEICLGEDFSSVEFRSHKRSFSGLESYIIGEENRKQKIKREIRNLKLDLKDFTKAADEIQNEIKGKNLVNKTLISFMEFMNKDTRILEKHISQFNELSSSLKNSIALIDDKQNSFDEQDREFNNLNNRLKNIRKIIETEGLANLENKIKELTAEQNELSNKLRNIDKKLGANEVQDEETENELAEKSQQLANHEKNFTEKVNEFAEKYKLTDSFEDYFNEQRTTFNLHNAVDCRNMANKARNEEIASKAVLGDRIRDKQFCIEFGFNYDEEKNLLIDRAQRNIKDICNKYDIEIREQQEIINERTTELFRKIIMDELVYYLRERIGHLQSMVKQINTLLKDRYFGNNQYVFKTKVQKKYERFINVIKKYNPLNEELEDELRNFFKDYRNEIVETEPNEIPELLDYRNWYIYEMYVKSPDSEGNVMDKRVKSIGSGGEQAVPNYLLILTISHFLYSGTKIKLPILIFDEAFYGIDAGRRDQLMGFAGDIGLQIFIATPDQDGVRKEIAHSTSLLVVKDENYNVHLYPFHWKNPESDSQGKLNLYEEDKKEQKIEFSEEL